MGFPLSLSFSLSLELGWNTEGIFEEPGSRLPLEAKLIEALCPSRVGTTHMVLEGPLLIWRFPLALVARECPNLGRFAE